jgi:hypothetical protein
MGCSNCGGNCEETDEQDCTCVAGLDAPLNRHGNGVPAVISTDRAGRLYFQDDSTPAGEVWFFNGVTWTDLGYALEGVQGVAGTAGSPLLDNNHTSNPTTGLGNETLKSYSLPAGTLSDGDALILTTQNTFAQNTNQKDTTIKFDGNSVGGGYGANSIQQVHEILETVITRINATAIRFSYHIKHTNVSFDIVAGIDLGGYIASNVIVSDMDLNAIAIICTGNQNGLGSAGDIVNDYFTVQYLKKI